MDLVRSMEGRRYEWFTCCDNEEEEDEGVEEVRHGSDVLVGAVSSGMVF